MARVHIGRSRRQLALDLMFFAWMGYVLLTGRLLPPEAISLFRNGPPAVVVTEPAAPARFPQIAADSTAPET